MNELTAHQLDAVYTPMLNRIHGFFRNLDLDFVKIEFCPDLSKPINVTFLHSKKNCPLCFYSHPEPRFFFEGKNFTKLTDVVAAIQKKEQKIFTKKDIEHYKADYEKGRRILQKIAVFAGPTTSNIHFSKSAERYDLPHSRAWFVLHQPDYDLWIGRNKSHVMRYIRCLSIFVPCEYEGYPGDCICSILPGSIRAKLKKLLKSGAI
ncbi:MAG: hypothetical protein DRN07_04425 [Thermoplasmata archaeon]|nr:MAG: hypothetical protein DRN07_04425 [Thermoplasmata archaeon]